MWLYLHNSVWTGAMNRPLRLRNVRCGLFTYTNIYPRTPTFTPRTPTFTPRAPTVGADLSCPHITEYTLQITVYNQCFTHVHPL